MLTILAPAKDLKVDPSLKLGVEGFSIPEFINMATGLITNLKRMQPADLSSIMDISPKLVELNYLRFRQWNKQHNPENSERAITAFKGEVYRGLKANDLSEQALQYAQQTLRILSGLYGVLRPLDLVQEYRLEMGTKHNFRGKKNLYEFWKAQIVGSINNAIENSPGEKILVNLASQEYYKAIDQKKIKFNVVTPVFKDERNGEYKVIIVYAKKARGMMARFIIDNKIEKVDELKAFDAEGYFYNAELSVGDKPVFTR